MQIQQSFETQDAERIPSFDAEVGERINAHRNVEEIGGIFTTLLLTKNDPPAFATKVNRQQGAEKLNPPSLQVATR